MTSLFIREITSSLMPAGQTASHSPMVVQWPKPSARAWFVIEIARAMRSGWPWGR